MYIVSAELYGYIKSGVLSKNFLLSMIVKIRLSVLSSSELSYMSNNVMDTLNVKEVDEPLQPFEPFQRQ